MAEYKGIKGFQVQTRSEDPVPYAQALANNPYAGAWSSGGNLNASKYALAGVGANNSAALVFGGYPNGPTGQTEQYNGTSWTEVNDLNNARGYLDGAGTYTSALAFAGYSTPPAVYHASTETWDGSSWTEVNDLNTGRSNGAGDGTQASALYFGGEGSGVPPYAITESWDGTNWTEVNDLNTARQALAGAGTSNTAAIAFGGGPNPSMNAQTESWNGSSWTEVNDLNTARKNLGGNGSTTAALAYGGRPPNPGQTQTESWDGTSWTEVNDLATARGDGASAGSSTSALYAGGYDGSTPFKNITEEWSFSGLDPSTTPAADYSNAIIGDFYYNSTTGQFKTLNDGGAPIGTWAAGGNLNTARYGAGSGGNVNSAIMAGGNTGGPYTNASESYDGSSWTTTPALNSGRGFCASATQSPATAAIVFAGYDGPPTSTNNAQTERWDGSSWTEVGDVNTARRLIGGAGATYDAALGFGGKTSPSGAQSLTESWNGSAWTEVADLNTARWESPGGFGTNTAAFAIGGYIPPGAYGTIVEEWNGSSWTETTDINTGRGQMAGTGLTTAGIIAGGVSPIVANTESWNGSSWTEVNDMSTARYGAGYGTGTGPTNLLFSGGYTTTDVANTEEFTAADFEIKSVTQS